MVDLKPVRYVNVYRGVMWGIAIINHQFSMVGIPPINMVIRRMAYYCYTNISVDIIPKPVRITPVAAQVDLRMAKKNISVQATVRSASTQS